VGDQDKSRTLIFIVHRVWSFSYKMTFADLMVWGNQKEHSFDLYVCLTNRTGDLLRIKTQSEVSRFVSTMSSVPLSESSLYQSLRTFNDATSASDDIAESKKGKIKIAIAYMKHVLPHLNLIY
jgi:hypothetical protein